jgi:phosphoribosylformylglycinamidine cyclo-ligase
MSITYEQAGVDRDKGDAFVSRIGKMVKSTYGKEVQSGVGGFASLYKIGGGQLLAAGCDGVGTKLKVAQILNKHDTIGIDLVAMCVNDVICTGARPLFFLDYLASGKLDLPTSEAVIKGIVAGCKQSGVALVGGETAEMPGMYSDGEYDLAGFCVGQVEEKKLMNGKQVKVGDDLVVLASSGPHSNGFSLIRKLIRPDETKLLQEVLTPTRIYVPSILAALKNGKFGIKGFAHITGSGFLNVPRINAKFGYHFDRLPKPPKIFQVLQERAGLDHKEMYSTFNMGVGFVIATNKGKALCEFLHRQGEKATLAGKVMKQSSVVTFDFAGEKFSIQ